MSTRLFVLAIRKELGRFVPFSRMIPRARRTRADDRRGAALARMMFLVSWKAPP